jgi:hypothetical protein
MCAWRFVSGISVGMLPDWELLMAICRTQFQRSCFIAAEHLD